MLCVSFVQTKSLNNSVADRPGHDKRYAIDSSKIKTSLGWKPEESFESGLRKTVQWYLDNKSWWESILKQDFPLKRIGTGELK